jgi:uncharacterized protein YbjT (DUF2867 family)
VVVRAVVHRGREAVVARPGVEVVQGNVTVPRSLDSAMERVDAVVHLVAVIRERPPRSPFNASMWKARATSSEQPATRGFSSSFT